MAQVKRFSWTNPSTAVARNLDCGFEPVHVKTIDVTNGGSWEWIKGMGDGYSLDVDAGTVATSNGFTPLEQDASFGASISAFTNASPGVIAVDDVQTYGYAAGDTIKVTAVADDQSTANSLNDTYTIASVSASANTITLDQNTSGDSVYVSGGYVIRVSDAAGDPIPTENFAIQGITVGTTPVGANDAAMVAICYGEEPVV